MCTSKSISPVCVVTCVIRFGGITCNGRKKNEKKNLIEFILCVRARSIYSNSRGAAERKGDKKRNKMFILYIVLIVLCLYLLWARRHIYILSWKMPGPPVYIPIVGNILSMWNEEGLSMIKSNFYIVLCSLTYGLTYAMAMGYVTWIGCVWTVTLHHIHLPMLIRFRHFVNIINEGNNNKKKFHIYV